MYKKNRLIALGFTFLFAISTLGLATGASADTMPDNNPVEEPTENNLESSSSDLAKKELKAGLPDNLTRLIDKYNPGLSLENRQKIYLSVQKYSEVYSVPEDLIISVIGCESEFTPTLYGALDDTGLMQIRMKFAPSWAKNIGMTIPEERADLKEIEDNIQMGTYILSYLIKKYDGNIHRVLIGYNAGAGYVDKKIKSGSNLPTSYLKRVNKFHYEYTNEYLSDL